MQQPIKAQRTTITIAGIELEGFKLPDGMKGLSQAQMAETIGLWRSTALRFLKSNEAKPLLDKGFRSSAVSVEAGELSGEQARRINLVPPELVAAFWAYQAERGNKKALALIIALAQETLDRRLDAAFGDVKSEQEREATVGISEFSSRWFLRSKESKAL